MAVRPNRRAPSTGAAVPTARRAKCPPRRKLPLPSSGRRKSERRPPRAFKHGAGVFFVAKQMTRHFRGRSLHFDKPTARGYHAPCFEGMVHCFMGSVLMRRDNGTSGTKCGACYCSIPRYPCFSAFPSKYRKANAGIRSKSLPHFVL